MNIQEAMAVKISSYGVEHTVGEIITNLTAEEVEETFSEVHESLLQEERLEAPGKEEHNANN